MPRDMGLEVVSRNKWGALSPKSPGIELEHPIEFIWLRSEPEMRPCLKPDKCIRAVQELQKRDMEAPKCIDINANFIIGDDGKIYEGRGFFVKPKKSKEFPKYDGEYLEIVYIGPLDEMTDLHTEKLVYTIEKFLYKGNKKGYINECPEFLGFLKDYIHTPEQYVEPNEVEIFTKAAKGYDAPEKNGQKVYHLVFDIIEYAVPKRFMIEEVAFLGNPPPWLT